MSNSFKATKEQVERIIDYYQNDKIEIQNDSFLFRAARKDFNVNIYKTGTVLFQGENAESEYKKWISFFDNANINNMELKEKENIEHIGSDEVGCGDYFGPIVVCATYVKKEDVSFLMDIGVKDSKQLTDKDIEIIAPLIKKKVQYASFILTPKKYNELHEKGYNLNKIKAYLHNFVLFHLVKETKFSGKIVVDQFCSEDLYYHYLWDYHPDEIQRNIFFTPKAENKYLAVACASILARNIFIQEIRKIKKQIGCSTLYLGANQKVDELALKIAEEKGIDYLKQFVKFHYKNTEKILEELNRKNNF